MDPAAPLARIIEHLLAHGANPLTIDGKQLPGLSESYCLSGNAGDRYVHAWLVAPSLGERTILALRLRTPEGCRASETDDVDRGVPYAFYLLPAGATRIFAISHEAHDAFALDVLRALTDPLFAADAHRSHLQAGPRGHYR